MAKFAEVGEVEQIFPSVWKWTVKNCSQYFQAAALKSPKFAMGRSNQTTNWRLGCVIYQSNMFLVSVVNFDQIDVIADIKWLGSNLSEPSNARSTNKLTFSKDSKAHTIIAEDFNCQNTLVMYCCIVVDSELTLRTPDEVDRLAVLGDFEKLLDNNKHSDVTLILPRNKQIYAHKAILSSRSPVFEAMFEHDMKEKQLNTVEITDVKYKIMKELLRFVYAGRVVGIYSISKELLAAADKYCIDELKALCEKTIYKQLNINNALGICKLAVTYNAAVLKKKVYGYIVKHIKDICKKPEFKQLDSMIKDELIAILADKI